jgi:putative copper resistance protein D
MGTAALIGAARWLQYAGAMILCGSPLFYLYSFEPGEAPAGWVSWRWPFTLIRVAAIVTFVGAVAWLIGESLSISDSAVEALSPAASVACALRHTIRAGLCGSDGIASVDARCAERDSAPPSALGRSGVILGAAVTMSFAWTGHGAMGSGSSGVGIWDSICCICWRRPSGSVHWLPLTILGAVLVAFAVGVSKECRLATLRGLERFSSIGPLVIALLVFSGIGNSWFLIGPSHWRARCIAPAMALYCSLRSGCLERCSCSPHATAIGSHSWLRADLATQRDMRGQLWPQLRASAAD